MQQPGYGNGLQTLSSLMAQAGPGPSSYSPPSASASNDSPHDHDAGSSERPKKKKSSDSQTKRRRSSVGEESGDGGTHQKGRDGSKKKKAARACVHCQKAHLTCDDSRPCQRCIKRGMSDQCVEGNRKKAKYLLNDSELEAIKGSKGAKNGTNGDASQMSPAGETFTPTDPLFNLTFDPQFSFGSEAANLEYSILSAILGNPNHDDPHVPLSQQQPPQQLHQFANAAWPAEPPQQPPQAPPQQSMTPHVLMPAQQPESVSFSAPGNSFEDRAYFHAEIRAAPPPPPPQINPDFMNNYQPPVQFSGQPPHPLQPPQLPIPQYTQSFTDSPTGPRPTGTPQNTPAAINQSASETSAMLATPPASTDSPISIVSGTDNSRSIIAPPTSYNQVQQTRNVYDAVTRKYDYTQGYHFLMKFLPTRFEKNDILRVVRALAIFRPSLIALQTPLSEEDEVFVEKCFQRSLTEMEKLISFSGTPTVVWRRTGEICLVGLEFTLLTEWDKDEMISGKKYIYELFESQSVVEYWENFASHAFENTTQSVYSHCVLLKPSGEPIPCTFCFSIRRDIFDLPSMVIGQWLPLL